MDFAVQDRRRHIRHERSFPLKLFEPPGKILDSTPILQDLSQEGLRFATPAVLNADGIFTFEIRLPSSKVVSGIARTRWLQRDLGSPDYIYGAEIEAITWLDKWRLRKNLERGRTRRRGLDLFDISMAFGIIGTVFWWMTVPDNPFHAYHEYVQTLFQERFAWIAPAIAGTFLLIWAYRWYRR